MLMIVGSGWEVGLADAFGLMWLVWYADFALVLRFGFCMCWLSGLLIVCLVLLV